MLAYLKMIPILVVLSGAAYKYHEFIVAQKDAIIVDLKAQLEIKITENATLQITNQTQKETIVAQEEHAKEQAVQIAALSESINQYQEEAQVAMEIFRRHNLERLARAKPGMIETRMQKGTDTVFQSIEEATK